MYILFCLRFFIVPVYGFGLWSSERGGAGRGWTGLFWGLGSGLFDFLFGLFFRLGLVSVLPVLGCTGL